MKARLKLMQCLAALALLVHSGCTAPAASPSSSSQKTKMQQYDWQATTCAPKAFPVRLLSATLHLADGEQLPIQPKSLIANGWGELGAVSLIGEDIKALPAELEIQWFSYVERKCYGGRFKLDQAKLAKTFDEKLIAPATDEKAEFTHLVVGLAPKGGISIWLSGEGVVQETEHLTAPEIQVAMQEIIGAYPDVEAYATDVIAQNLDAGQVAMSNVADDDLKKWAVRYRRDYRWHWAVTATSQTKGVLAHYFNGEAFYWPQTPDKTTSFSHPLPGAVTVRWDGGGSTESATLHFDDAELFAAFEKLGGPGAEAGIRLEINRVMHTGKAFVESGNSIIELKKTRAGE